MITKVTIFYYLSKEGMRQMKSDISIKLSKLKEITTYHYKVILYLDGVDEATQTQMSKEFETTKQRVNKVCKELASMDIIQVKRTEGRNVFWTLNPKPEFQIIGQLKLEDI